LFLINKSGMSFALFKKNGVWYNSDTGGNQNNPRKTFDLDFPQPSSSTVLAAVVAPNHRRWKGGSAHHHLLAQGGGSPNRASLVVERRT
jgi:hypothetical protein